MSMWDEIDSLDEAKRCLKLLCRSYEDVRQGNRWLLFICCVQSVLILWLVTS